MKCQLMYIFHYFRQSKDNEVCLTYMVYNQYSGSFFDLFPKVQSNMNLHRELLHQCIMTASRFQADAGHVDDLPCTTRNERLHFERSERSTHKPESSVQS